MSFRFRGRLAFFRPALEPLLSNTFACPQNHRPLMAPSNRLIFRRAEMSDAFHLYAGSAGQLDAVTLALCLRGLGYTPTDKECRSAGTCMHMLSFQCHLRASACCTCERPTPVWACCSPAVPATHVAHTSGRNGWRLCATSASVLTLMVRMWQGMPTKLTRPSELASRLQPAVECRWAN